MSSPLPAVEALRRLQAAVAEAEPGLRDDEHVHGALLTLVLRLVFSWLADARGLLDNQLSELHGSLAAGSGLGSAQGAGAWPQLLRYFDELHQRRKGCLFAPARVAALRGVSLTDATVFEVLDGLRVYAEAEVEVEILGGVYEAMRTQAERRRASAHYTPRVLAEGVVLRTIDPLLRTRGPASLAICDPAMGSGAFLLAVCRLLGAQLGGEDGPLSMALTCVYGVDEDPEAVELGKLSLWLETRAHELAFDCFDHALRCGDSLVGLRVDQLRSLRWKPERSPPEPAGSLIDVVLERAARLRERVSALTHDTGPAAAARRADSFRSFHEHDETVAARELGDRVMEAFFSSTKARARSQALARVSAKPRARSERSARPSAGPRPFHWCIEFPQLGAGGFDAIVGNPPFLGKNGILDKRGRAYLDWLKVLHPGSHGNADYSAHFFRRANDLLGEGGGTIGLVATNTIGQGDTRTTGLAQLLASGAEIYEVVEHLEWPGAANVTVSIVHLARGSVSRGLPRRLAGRSVDAIDSRLQPRTERPDPVALAANQRLAFIGTYVLGRGFVLTASQRDALLARDPRNAQRVRPYIGGEQVNASPTQEPRRFAIDFGDMSLEAARAWPDLLDIVRREVKPGRDKLKDNPDGRRRKAHWWQHGRVTPSLHAALAPLSRCLVTSLVSKHLVFAFQPAQRLFSHKLCVFPLESWAAFAVLQSRVHGAWAWLLSSTMRNAGINYSPSDCFETFALPELGPDLDGAGERLDRARARYMRGAEVGLTKTYNALADPDRGDASIEALRELHVGLDRAVLAAYGWDDLHVPEYLGSRVAFDDEVIERLFALNAERAGTT